MSTIYLFSNLRIIFEGRIQDLRRKEGGGGGGGALDILYVLKWRAIGFVYSIMLSLFTSLLNVGVHQIVCRSGCRGRVGSRTKATESSTAVIMYLVYFPIDYSQYL